MNQSTIQSFNKPKIHVDKFHPIEKEGCFVSLYLGLSHLRAHIYEFQCHRPQTLRLPKVPRCEYGRLKNLILISVFIAGGNFFPSAICEDWGHSAEPLLFANQRRLRPRHMERRSGKSGSVQFQFIGSNK